MSGLHLLAFYTPSGAELLIIMVIALLLFGRRLPEVARNLGKGVVEFKKGLKGIEDDVDHPPLQSSKAGSVAGPTYAGGSTDPQVSSQAAPPPGTGEAPKS